MSTPAAHFAGRSMAPRGCLYTPPGADGLRFRCSATRTREVFGRREYHILPALGDGGRWVTASALEWTTPDGWDQVTA